jgi:hypothetical protein
MDLSSVYFVGNIHINVILWWINYVTNISLSLMDLQMKLQLVFFFFLCYNFISDYIPDIIKITHNIFFICYFIDNYTSNKIRFYTPIEYFIGVLLFSTSVPSLWFLLFKLPFLLCFVLKSLLYTFLHTALLHDGQHCKQQWLVIGKWRVIHRVGSLDLKFAWASKDIEFLKQYNTSHNHPIRLIKSSKTYNLKRQWSVLRY